MSTRGTFVPNLVKIRSRGLLGKGVKYNFLCDFYLFFSLNTVEKRPLDEFWRAMAQKTQNRTRMCLLEVIKWKIENLTPIYPQTLKIWPGIGNFQPKWWNMKLQVYQKVLNQSRWKFNTIVSSIRMQYDDVAANPIWRTAAILKIVFWLYLNEWLSD